jgi:hypothetical protein
METRPAPDVIENAIDQNGLKMARIGTAPMT